MVYFAVVFVLLGKCLCLICCESNADKCPVGYSVKGVAGSTYFTVDLEATAETIELVSCIFDEDDELTLGHRMFWTIWHAPMDSVLDEDCSLSVDSFYSRLRCNEPFFSWCQSICWLTKLVKVQSHSTTSNGSSSNTSQNGRSPTRILTLSAIRRRSTLSTISMLSF